MFFLSYNGIEVSRMKQDHKEHYLVVKDQRGVKANDLIQKSRFDLSLQEQKIILYLISQITPYDEEFKLYEFSITDFCKICGIDHTSGGNYADLKNAIKEISDKSIWISIDHDQETLLRWIEKPYLNKRSGTIKIRLDEDMKPYLLQLKKNFTTYELIFTLRFRSKYSIRLYELISSIHYHTLESYTRKYTIDELRQLMGATTYKTWQTFKTRALIPAVNEINQFSNKNLEYKVIKQGRSIIGLELQISDKGTMEAIRLRGEIEKEFGYDQLTFWDELKGYGYVK